MASHLTSQYIESLTVNTIFTRGDNNTNIPAFRVLTTDGMGGTMWTTLSSLQYGAGYHTIITSGARYTADSATNASFSLLDGPNVGLINDPTASNTSYLYAKAFGQFDISGGNSITCFDSNTNQVNSNVLFVGTGGINIKADPQTNTMYIDGRELPFVSTLPYSFNQMVVYSNAPVNTIAGSTVNKSIIMQAQGPSTILSFLGEDMIVIDTNYEKNQIKFKLSTLTLVALSTIIGDAAFLKNYAVNSFQLSTMSTSYGTILSYNDFQKTVCTMSTTIYNKINANSTIIGDLNVYSRGISSVWRQYQLNRYFTGLTAGSNLVSTSATYGSEIDALNQRVFNEANYLTASTVRTPYFWTSTVVRQLYAHPEAIASPTPSVSPLNMTFYNTYSSFYNVFNDTQQFGSPISPTIYATSLDMTSGSALFSTVSTVSKTIFSTMFAVQGSFVFLPNQDPHPFSVSWSGNLSLNINGTEYASNPIPYPRMDAFVTSNTITGSIPSQPVCIVNFSYSKIKATDFLRFSNLTDYIAGAVEYYNVAPIYQAYGYNTNEAPIYSQTINSFPVAISSLSNLVNSPFVQLSTYVMIASTFYTSGNNTTFPVAANGYTSLTFYESTTTNSMPAYNLNLSNSRTRNFPITSFSASNAFGYNFNSLIPNSPYTLEIVYGRQYNSELFYISTLYNQNFQYTYDPTFYISSGLYTTYTSSIQTDIRSLTVSTINGVAYKDLEFRDGSTISTIYWNLWSLTSSISGSIQNYSSSLIQYGVSVESTISTVYIGLYELLGSLSSSIDNFSSSLIQYGTSADSTISTTYKSLDSITSTLIGDIDYFSTSLVDVPSSNKYSDEIRVSTLYTSTITLSGLKQPFIQYGTRAISLAPVSLPVSYTNNTYAIQLTYSNTSQRTRLLYASTVTSNQFYVNGDTGANFYWTTFGQLF